MPERVLLRDFKPVAFVTVRDADQARTFYRDTLGLRFVEDALPFAIVFDAHGVMLRIAIDPHASPSHGTVLGWDVPDIRVAVACLVERGVQFERYDFLQQDGDGIWTSPGGGMIAWFKDPDGNVLSLSQFPGAPDA